MGTLLLWCAGIVIAWLFASQFVAWMLAVDRESVISMWAFVFLAPVIFPMIAAAYATQFLLSEMRVTALIVRALGLPVLPVPEVKENPMEYLL